MMKKTIPDCGYPCGTADISKTSLHKRGDELLESAIRKLFTNPDAVPDEKAQTVIREEI